ncbi:MAG: SCO family protein [Thermoanaerobaculia bacterium]
MRIPGCFLLGFLCFGAACRRDIRPIRQDRTFPLRGVIVSLDPSRRTITVRHDDVPGLMTAMTMSFPVDDDTGGLSELSPGDQITAELRLTGHGAQIGRISVIGSEDLPKLDSSRILPPGSAVPDFKLNDQDGKTVTLVSLSGKALLVSFLYTRCPLPDACPMTLAKLARAAALMKPGREWRIVAVTLDPKNDTPAVLKEYARQVNTASGNWLFLTGDRAAVYDLSERLGVLAAETKGRITHSLAAAIIGPDGRLVSRREGRDWTPEQVSADLTRAAPLTRVVR